MKHVPKRILPELPAAVRRRRDALTSRGLTDFRLVEDMVHDVFFVIAVEDEDAERYRFIHVNSGFERATGLAARDVVGQLIDQVIPPASLPLVKRQYRAALLTQAAVHWDEVSTYPTGTKVGEISVLPIADPATGQTVLIGTAHDVTERHFAQARLAELEERWRLALDASDTVAWDWDRQADVINVSPQWQGVLGREPAPLPATAKTLKQLVHPADRQRVLDAYRTVRRGGEHRFAFELRLRHAGGRWVWMRCCGRAYVLDHGGIRLLGTLTDISAAKNAEEQLWHEANYDGLTGLPNRRRFLERMRTALRQIHEGAPGFVLLYVDLDQFKEINDTLGHATGDRLLRQVARRLVGCLPPSAMIARLGGDEFTVLLDSPHVPDATETTARRILRVLAPAFQLDEEALFISASIGIACCPSDGHDVDSLLKHADQAMYEAKRLGHGRYAYFVPDMQAQAQRRRQMIHDLRHALQRGEFEVLYQPIVELGSSRIRKTEALLRWNHPVQGRIEPTEFIPLCEETGLIIEIGEWVFETVVRDAARWYRQGWHKLKVGLNVSPVQIRDGKDSCARCLGLLTSLQLPPGTIVAEVTEGSLLRNDPVVQEQLQHMREHGIDLALDDFGTGYSALSYLQHYTFAYLKIDRSFVHDMARTSRKRALCETIILMAHRMGMRVIAEGIESELDLELLRMAGCDFGQGFRFSHAVTASDLEAQLTGADNVHCAH